MSLTPIEPVQPVSRTAGIDAAHNQQQQLALPQQQQMFEQLMMQSGLQLMDSFKSDDSEEEEA